MVGTKKRPRTIRLRIWIDKQPAVVYQALTEPSQLASWLVPSVEPVEGKEKTFLFKWPHHSFEVVYLEAVPDRHIVISWYDERGIGPIVRFEIELSSQGSMVTLIHDGFDPEEEFLESYTGHIEGWTMYLCNLKCFLDFGRDLRADQPPGTIAL